MRSGPSDLSAPRLTCRELVALLTDHLEGVLMPDTSARVEAHLATCPDCTAYVEQFRTTIATVGRLRDQDVPPAVLDELVDAFRRWPVSQRRIET
jgi:anti-sigma factor RsiW